MEPHLVKHAEDPQRLECLVSNVKLDLRPGSYGSIDLLHAVTDSSTEAMYTPFHYVMDYKV